VHNQNDQLDQSEKMMDSLNNQLNCEKDKLRRAEYQIEDLERDMSLKNDEVFIFKFFIEMDYKFDDYQLNIDID
jgi:hypothetical protein